MTSGSPPRGALASCVRSQIRRGLDGVWVRGVESVLAAQQSRPVVLAATHSASWDARLLVPLDDALGRSGRVWVDSDTRRCVPFFGPLGSIPVDPSSIGGVRRSVRSATRWLSEPGRTLWIFPQGERLPGATRPLGVRPGAAWLAKHVGAALIPVGISYGPARAATPRAAVSFGPPVDPDNLEGGLLQQLTCNDRFLRHGDPWFEPLLPSGRDGGGQGAGKGVVAPLAWSAGHG